MIAACSPEHGGGQLSLEQHPISAIAKWRSSSRIKLL
jgi:hypothetical protein